MSKYTCACGYVMNLSQGWSGYELTLIPESTIEGLGDRLDSEGKLSSDQLYEAIDEKAITVYRCPKCRRLHLEEEPNKFTTYIVE
ncbi:hypothetical protein SRABI06_03142 [Pseudomonas brassicacearum]|nr:hypothetical protein SRABI06_03142 [Pseudomonas brassicacearum]